MKLKKLMALAGAAVLAITLSACGGPVETLPKLETESGSSSGASGVESTAPVKADDGKFQDDLDGLCAYLEESKAVVRSEPTSSGGQDASFTEMSYKEIGAIGGYRYRFTYNNSTVQAEFYEFDPDNLDEKGQECLSSVKEKGFFTLLEKEIPATLHPNGRYLMIYTDTKADDLKNGEKNAAHRDLVEKLFLEFKA